MQTPKKRISKSEFAAKEKAYGDYLTAKSAYDKDKAEYTARWNKANKISGGSINPYNFEAAPKEPERPTMFESSEPMAKMATKKASFNAPSGKLRQPKETKKTTEGWFGDIVPHTSGVSNKQLKQFASYASKTNLGESFIAKPKSAIDQYKNEMKGQRRQYIKEGNIAGIKATTADIRQARNAAKFTASNNPLDVPGMATGYRAAQDNAANRNTIKQQVKTLKGFGRKY